MRQSVYSNAIPALSTPHAHRLCRNHERHRQPRHQRHLVEVLIVAALCALVAAITHDIPYLLSTPYWLDEAWVAVGTRLPFADILVTGSSSPPLWNLLQRGFPIFGLQAARLVPLAFIAATAVAAYCTVRVLLARTRSEARIVSALAAAAVLLVPATLQRNDLKQYTCDTFVVLTYLCVTALGERWGWSTARLWTLAMLGPVGFALSIASVFVWAVAVAAVTAWWLARRHWRTLRRAALPLALGIVGVAILCATVYAPADIPSLRHFWDAYYPTLTGLPTYFWHRAATLSPSFGPGGWLVSAALAAVACLGLGLRRRGPITAILPGVVAVVCLAGVLHRYPLLDARTSYFLVVLTTFFAILGAWFLVSWTFRLLLYAHHTTARRSALAFVIAATAVLAVAYPPTIRQHTIAHENARDQIRYTQEHYTPGDVVLITRAANYAMGYYWTLDQPSWTQAPEFSMGFKVTYPNNPRIIIALDDATTWINRATSLAQGHKVWVIRSHMPGPASTAWQQALAHAQLINTGSEPLALIIGD